MTTLTFPSGIVPNQSSWHLEPNTAVFVSPLSRAVQTLELAGARWVCSMTFPPMATTVWRVWTAWVAKMRGSSGRVYFGPPHYTGISAPSWTPNLSAVTCDSTAVKCDSTTLVDQTDEMPWGAPIARGAGQTGEYIRTDGWVAAVTVMAAGDFLSYDTSRGRTLHMVVEDAVSNTAGVARIRIEPPIRTSPEDDAEIEVTTPTCVMALKDGMAGSASWSPYLKASVSVDLVESF